MAISKKTIIFQGFRGGPLFSRGGVKMLISIETHHNLWYSKGGGGGSGPPIPLSGSTLEKHMFSREISRDPDLIDHQII